MEKETIEKFWENNPHDFAGDRRSKLIHKLSKKYIGEKTLDIGAGSGALIKRIPGAIGVDLVENEMVRKMDISKLEFEDSKFNTVFATEVLEHLNEEMLNKGLEEVKRVLKLGGYFILTVPYNEDLKKGRVICPKCDFDFHLWQHLNSFNEKNIKELLFRKGFKVIKTQVNSFRLYELGWKFYLFEPIISKLYKDLSKTMLVVAKKI
tara:strand:+ start:1529 stop:2149 length:621 start_codon:yes stop_codon:yes gene_type:complete